jgi:hypothetical protein
MLTRQAAAVVLLPEQDLTYLSNRYSFFVMEHFRTRYLVGGTSGFGSADAALRFRVFVPDLSQACPGSDYAATAAHNCTAASRIIWTAG